MIELTGPQTTEIDIDDEEESSSSSCAGPWPPRRTCSKCGQKFMNCCGGEGFVCNECLGKSRPGSVARMLKSYQEERKP